MRQRPPSRPAAEMSARLAACTALLRSAKGEIFAQDALHQLFENEARRLNATDRALATELTLGTVRHRRTLHVLLSKHLTREISTVPEPARLTLEVGAYQLIFLQRIPDYAIVNSAVEVVREIRAPGLTGLVNAILRKVAGMVESRVESLPAGHPLNPRRLLPLPHGGIVVFKSAVFSAEVVEQLGEVYSFPDLLVGRWLGNYGQQQTTEMLAAMNRPPRIMARVNGLRATREVVLNQLGAVAAERATAAGGEESAGLLDLTDVPHEVVSRLLDAGLVTIQDRTTLLPVEAMGLGDLAHGRVLDLCAAPGGKTSYIAERVMGAAGVRVVATDRKGDRLDLLRGTVARLGLRNVDVLASEDLPPTVTGDEQRFDRVLADVPCSNTGVMHRRAEARWRFSEADLLSLTRMQRGLLERAIYLTRVGGVCVYSTCSTEPEENENLVRGLLADHPEVELRVERTTLPSERHDGGYYAALGKREK